MDINNQPDLQSLKSACKIVGEVLSPGNIVIFESTVYPGATEEVCVPIFCQTNPTLFTFMTRTIKTNNIEGFYCGYSPERFAPGEGNLRITEIIKVTSGSTKKSARKN